MRTIGYTGTNFSVDLVVNIGLGMAMGLTLAVYTTDHAYDTTLLTLHTHVYCRSGSQRLD